MEIEQVTNISKPLLLAIIWGYQFSIYMLVRSIGKALYTDYFVNKFGFFFAYFLKLIISVLFVVFMVDLILEVKEWKDYANKWKTYETY